MVDKFIRAMYIRNSLWVLLLLSSLSYARKSDINCLRDIKSQLKDPSGSLSSWEISENSREGYICNLLGVTCWNAEENRVLLIDLAGYGLEGEFPSGLKDCWDLTGLNLSGNRLSGKLPLDLPSILPVLTTLDLSNNSFSGDIPAEMSEIVYLNTLMLDHNKFTGKIPPALASLTRLKQFSLAHNHLHGPIPEFTNGNMSVLSFKDNLDLCGLPLDPCSDSSDSIYSMGIKAATIASATFFPLGAFFGWFCVGKKQK